MQRHSLLGGAFSEVGEWLFAGIMPRQSLLGRGFIKRDGRSSLEYYAVA